MNLVLGTYMYVQRKRIESEAIIMTLMDADYGGITGGVEGGIEGGRYISHIYSHDYQLLSDSS
jgi:hypothetical protein